MADHDKTEQATPRRRQKAREQGQVVRSRELPSAIAGLAGLLLVLWLSPEQLNRWRGSLRLWTELAWHGDFSVETPVLLWTLTAALRWALPPLALAWCIALASSVAQGGFVFAGEALLPKPERLSPAKKLGQLFSTAGLSTTAKSLIPCSVLLYLVFSMLVRDWELLQRASLLPVIVAGQFLYQRVLEVVWKATLVMLAWAGIDYLLQRQKMEHDLRMSRQEIREEFKETDGHPTIKARIRRLQRQLRRRRMLQDVAQATVVVTNPTHFAIALQYRPQMAVPVVVAKGRDALAEQIKRVALWHEVPIIENKPLAQALYRSVEVGQAIPAKLYAAVAELLAFIYRAQMRAQQAAHGGRR